MAEAWNVTDASSASEKLNEYFNESTGVFSNSDIFYENQMNQLALTWRLKNNDKIILKGLLSELELSYSVSTNWGSSSSGIMDALANAGNKIIDFGRQADMTLGMINDLATQTTALGGAGRYMKEAIGDVRDYARDAIGGEIYDKIARYFKTYTNAHIISSSNYVKVFNGTDIKITAPQLSVTLFDYSDREKGSLIDVLKALNAIQVGSLKDATKVIGVQEAPNGFEATFETIGSDKRIPGTVSLEVGDKYIIKNLLISNMDAKLSTMKRNQAESNKLMPLYADVSISLEYATMITRDTLNDMLFSQFE